MILLCSVYYLIAELILIQQTKAICGLMTLSMLIFSLLTITYHKLTESVNLRCQSAAAVWDSFNGHIKQVVTNFIPIKYRQFKQSNNKSSKFKKYPSFITKWLAKKLACSHHYKSRVIFNHNKHLENKIIDSNNVGYYKFVNNKKT